MSHAALIRHALAAALVSLTVVLAVTAVPALAGRSRPINEGNSCFSTPSLYLPHESNQSPQRGISGNALARCQGGLGYSDRPAAIRVVLDRMYGNDHRYHRFSALFVDRLPGQAPGSARLFVSQPRSGVAAIYPNTSGTGTPREIRRAYGENMDRYSPAAGVFTTGTRVLQPLPLPPLDSMPPNIQQGDFTGVSFSDAIGTRGATALANIFLQPSGLITGDLFTHKAVKLEGVSTFDGRSTWVLFGRQIPTIPRASGEPAAWRMWVDRATGIVLKLEYLSNGHITGRAFMRQVRIDGAGTTAGGGDGYAGWVVPASARYVAPLEYGTSQSPSGSGPIDWTRHHLDIVVQIALILVLILIWWIVGRRQPRKLQHSSQAGSSGTSD